MTVVRTQAELDAAAARGDAVIEIDSPAGVWLTVDLPRSSRAVLWGSSRAVLRESSHAVLRESSHAELWGSSRAVLWESSRAELRESSRAELWGSSHAVASSHVAVHLHSALAQVSGGVLIDCTRVDSDAAEWCDYHGVTVSKAGVATLYKAVDDNYRSKWGGDYTPGTKPSAPDWRDDNGFGGGLHFSPSPREARDYHVGATRFVEVGVKVADLRPIPGGTAKCKAPRVVRACREVDIDGRRVS